MKFDTILLRKSTKLLSVKSKNKIILLSVLNLVLSIFDLLGVILIGVCGSLVLSGVQSTKPLGKIQDFLELINVNNLTFQTQVAFLGAAAAFCLLFRTVSSMLINRKTLIFLSNESAEISVRVLSEILKKPAYFIKLESGQKLLFAITSGIDTIVVRVVGTCLLFLTDFFLVIIIGTGIFFIDFKMATLIFLVFALTAFFTFKFFNKKAVLVGKENAELNINLSLKILEVLSFYREAYVRSTRESYSKEISKIRYKLATSNANLELMPSTSKYVTELTIVITGLLITIFQFITKDATHAVTVLTVYLAAGARLAPAVLRIQSSIITIKSGTGNAQKVFELMEKFEVSFSSELEESFSKDLTPNSKEKFIPEIQFNNVYFAYPKADLDSFEIKDLTFSVASGSILAIVGPSGAGKTSIIDLLLGILIPTSGEILLSGVNPQDAIRNWPGEIAYVPQDIAISSGNIKENILLGFEKSDYSDSEIYKVLQISQLKSFVESLPNKIYEEVGEKGAKLSGGERQRLGIARALITNPHLLILDEATSSLDGVTESELTQAITDLAGSVTIVVIAHRLSTVRKATKLLYIENGQIKAQGSFKELRDKIPEFENQVKLMGLN